MGLKNRLEINFVYSRHGKTLLLQVASCGSPLSHPCCSSPRHWHWLFRPWTQQIFPLDCHPGFLSQPCLVLLSPFQSEGAGAKGFSLQKLRARLEPDRCPLSNSCLGSPTR